MLRSTDVMQQEMKVTINPIIICHIRVWRYCTKNTLQVKVLREIVYMLLKYLRTGKIDLPKLSDVKWWWNDYLPTVQST